MRPLPRDVILFATADWDAAFWTNKQHLACGLAREGFRVLYVESLGLRRPTVRRSDLARMARRLGRALHPLRQVRERIQVLSPLVIPLHGGRLLGRLNQAIVASTVRFAAAWLGFRDPILWTYHPLVVPLLSSAPHSLLVYHCVDRLAAAPHLPAALLERTEPLLLQAADVVFATSRALRAECEAGGGREVHYLPNVADFAHFAAAREPGPEPPDLRPVPRPRLGFLGAISDYKVDFGLIAEVARRRPDWHWVLIGQVGEGQPGTSIELLRRPNIHLLGPKSYDVLPDYLRGFDIACIPARTGPYTEAMFPMKFFEYLAAGKPVVAANVPALREFAGACRLVDSVDAFAVAVAETLEGKVPDPALGLALARHYTWDWRLRKMREILETHWSGVRRQAA